MSTDLWRGIHVLVSTTLMWLNSDKGSTTCGMGQKGSTGQIVVADVMSIAALLQVSARLIT
jgi:hypothetical protein